MVFSRWRVGCKKENASLAHLGEIQTGQLARTNRRYLEHSDYLLPKDKDEEYRLNFQRAPREV